MKVLPPARRPLNSLRPLLIALLFCALANVQLFAASVTLSPSADATLFEVNPGNAAGGDDFFISGTTQNRTQNRALLQFDIASAIPAGSQITGIGLQLEVTRVPGDGFEASLFGLHPVLRSWGEGTTVVDDNFGGLGAPAAPGDATWLDRFHGSLQAWAVPGGAPGIDYNPEFSGSIFIFGTDVYNVEETPGLIADVQSWLDNPQSNFGWMLISTSEDLPFTARRFASREDPNGGGPLLFVNYEPVPEPATWGLLCLGALCLGVVRLARRRVR